MQPTSDKQGTTRAVLDLPYRWFRNIIRIQEKRAFSIYAVLLFCTFVGIARVMGEWFLGAQDLGNVIAELIGYSVFYWYSFFTFGLILFLLVPQPWRISINVILIGIFLGVLPPLFDLLIYDLGTIRYTYFWSFPTGWNFWIYNPDYHFHFGETIVLWMTIFLTPAYVAYKTRSIPRTVIAAVLAYGVVGFNGGVLPSTLRSLQNALGWDFGHLFYMMLTAQIGITVLLYILFQPGLRRGLLSRTHHSLPFVMMSLLGAALVGELSVQSFWYAALVWFMFQTALVQNDYYDTTEDSFQGREPYADLEDVRFFTVTALMLVFAVLFANSAAGMMLLMILVLSFLYSYPFYRGKRYFPSNLKIEGGWGLAAFITGMIGALEFGIHDAPRWMSSMGDPDLFHRSPGTPGWGAITACLLVFGGHSMLAIFKDYKDMDADRHGGIHTVYTLAARGGVDPQRIHRVLAVITLACLPLPLVLLYAAGLLGGFWALGGFLCVAAIGTVIFDLREKRKFDMFLWAMTGYLFYLLVALVAS